MKKQLILIVSILLLISLCACSKPREPYTVKEGWRTFEIDPEACTITFKTDVYQYEISGNGLEYEIAITYPNGYVYYEGRKETYPTGYRLPSRNRKPGPETYIAGDILCKLLENEIPTPEWHNLGSENVVSISKTGHGALCAIEQFYEDEYGVYYFPYIGDAYHITVSYIDGTTENIIPAIEAGRVTLIDLQKYGIKYGLDPKVKYWPVSEED